MAQWNWALDINRELRFNPEAIESEVIWFVFYRLTDGLEEVRTERARL